MGKETNKKNTLSVQDNRTGKTYIVPIHDNAIDATVFKAIRAEPEKGERKEDESESGIRVYDPGFMNTVGFRYLGSMLFICVVPAVAYPGILLFRHDFTYQAVLSSSITYINGDKGILRYRCVCV